MKINLSYKILGAWLLSLPLFFFSCMVEDVEADGTEEKSMLVTFSLDVKSQTASRADGNTWGEEYPKMVGNSLENRIDVSTLYVVAYNSDYSYKTDLPILLRQEQQGTATFLCALPDFEKGKEYRFVVLANCINKNYGISFKDGMPDLNALVYSNIQNTIPMWGVKTYTIPSDIQSGSELDLGSISMLRAAAKIGVKLGAEVKGEGYQIKSLKLNYANTNGFCVPPYNNWYHFDIKLTENLKHTDSFNPTSGVLSRNVNAMARGSETDGYYIYVPETVNDAADPLSLAVTLAKSTGEEVTFDYAEGIKFCTYNDGAPTDDRFNIVRNHFYDYTITAINMGLKMQLEVADWEDEPIWELDFSAPVHTNLLIAPDNHTKPAEEATLSYDNQVEERGAFVGYFKMESPAETAWKPTLTNASAADYEVRVYTNGETNPDEFNIPVTDAEIMASKDQWFKIVVVAKNPNLVGKVVKLGLSYTASWNDENTLLIINKGENNEMFYPWTDNDQEDSKDDPDMHWISIKQVSNN